MFLSTPIIFKMEINPSWYLGLVYYYTEESKLELGSKFELGLESKFEPELELELELELLELELYYRRAGAVDKPAFSAARSENKQCIVDAVHLLLSLKSIIFSRVCTWTKTPKKIILCIIFTLTKTNHFGFINIKVKIFISIKIIEKIY